MSGVPADVLTSLEVDVTRTLGDEYRHFVLHAAGDVRTREINDPAQKVVDDVQQRIHNEFIDTTWPACPRHGDHPLWYESGGWWCDRDKAQIAPLGGLRPVREPTFPIRVVFHEDGDEWVLGSVEELVSSLEWFDSDDPAENASVVDASGRRVRLRVEWLELRRLELADQ
jgi:hypothetical protein